MTGVETSNWAALVVIFDPGPEIRRCLKCLVDTDATEIIVWDNSPTSLASDLLAEEFPTVTFLGDGTNYGFGTANNLALAQVEEAIRRVLLINPDCTIDQQTVENLAHVLSTQADAAVATPNMVYGNGDPGIAGGPFPTIMKEVISVTGIGNLIPRSWRPLALSLYSKIEALRTGSNASYEASGQGKDAIIMDWTSGFCMFCSRDALEAVQGFDERFFLYFEDVDLCKRLQEAGYKVYLDRTSQAFHAESTSTGPAGKGKHYRLGMSTYFDIHGTKWQRKAAREIERVLS